jgi:hypothetical protein
MNPTNECGDIDIADIAVFEHGCVRDSMADHLVE